MTDPERYGPVARERAEARRTLRLIRDRLLDNTATPDDHRPALDAVMVLPPSEAEQWLEEIRTGFIDVYARERARNRSDQQEGAPEARPW